ALRDKVAAGARAGAPSREGGAPAVQLASWSSLYGANADEKAKALKAEIGGARPGWCAARELTSGGKQGTKVDGFKLTAADILEVVKAAESERGVNNVLGQPGTADRKTHEDQMPSY